MLCGKMAWNFRSLILNNYVSCFGAGMLEMHASMPLT